MICGYGGDLDGGNGGGADEPKCNEDIRKMPHIVAATSEKLTEIKLTDF